MLDAAVEQGNVETVLQGLPATQVTQASQAVRTSGIDMRVVGPRLTAISRPIAQIRGEMGRMHQEPAAVLGQANAVKERADEAISAIDALAKVLGDGTLEPTTPADQVLRLNTAVAALVPLRAAMVTIKTAVALWLQHLGVKSPPNLAVSYSTNIANVATVQAPAATAAVQTVAATEMTLYLKCIDPTHFVIITAFPGAP